MKRGTRLVLLSVVVGVSVLLAGCFTRSVDPADVFKVVIDLTDYAYDATLDFGLVNPDGDPSVVAGELHNITDGDITVTGVSTDNAVFSVGTEALPFTVLAGESTSVSLTFDPAASGAVTAVLTAVIDGADLPFIMSLVGEGNYPPAAEAIVEVSGAGTAAANGTYYRTDETENTYPVYRLTGTDYRMYGANLDEIAWLIDDDFDTEFDFYSHYSNTYSAPNGATSDWGEGTGTLPRPSSIGEIKSSSGAVYDLPAGDVISPNYLYADSEADAEGTTLYQWYRSDAFDPTGAYSLIEGETGSPHTVDGSGGYSYYLKVLVTPVATDGITTGEPVWFGPSPVVWVS